MVEPRPKIGFVLSGGGSRGAYEAGIIHYLRTDLAKQLGRHVPLDIVTGTIFASNTKAADGITRFVTFAILITWYYALGKSQNAYVVARFGASYKRKGWGKPLGLAIGGLVAFIALMGVLGFIYGALSAAT